MQAATGGFIQTVVALPLFRSEWVLYLLIALSIASLGVMLERWIFFRRRRLDVPAVHSALSQHLQSGDFAAAARLLEAHDSLPTNVVLAGLRAASQGPESVEDLI